MQSLSMGANTPLSAQRFEVVIDWPHDSGTLDPSAYLLTSKGRVRGDADMIFYNQRSDAAGAVQLVSIESGRVTLSFDLAMIAPEIEKITICVTIEDEGRTMAAFSGLSAKIRANGEAVAGFTPDLRGAREVALRLVDIYRRNGVWKLRADGQGFNDGLAPLARSFGIDVASDEGNPPRNPEPVRTEQSLAADAASQSEYAPAREVIQPAQLKGGAGAPVPAATNAGLTVERPTREWKAGPADHPGQITCLLSWQAERGGQKGRARELHLSLGCLYELKDGRQGLVQQEDWAGDYEREPFVHLVASSDGQSPQKLLVNGGKLHGIRRLLPFAFILREAPNWSGAEARLEITAQGRDPIQIDLNYVRDGFGMVALAYLEHVDETLKIERCANSFPGHQELAAQFGWHLDWKPVAESP